MCQNKQEFDFEKIQANDSNLILKNGVLYHKKKPYDGLCEQYNPFTKITKLTTYKLGKKEGLETKTYKDSSLAEQRFYKNGFKTGIHRGFWKDGSLKFEYCYNNSGFYEGSFKEWSKGGQLIKEFHYANGKEKGSQKMWNTNGTIRANYVVKHGERYGLIGLKKCYSIDVESKDL